MDYNPLKLFGQHVVKLRRRMGWTQEKLALESGMGRSFIGGIERGQRDVALLNICVLAETLQVDLSEMLDFLPEKLEIT